MSIDVSHRDLVWPTHECNLLFFDEKNVQVTFFLTIIPAISPMIPTATITTRGFVPAFVEVCVGVCGTVTLVVGVDDAVAGVFAPVGERETIAAEIDLELPPPGKLTVVIQES